MSDTVCDAEKLSRFIKNRRKKLHITQKSLSSQLGISNKIVSSWETGRTCPDVFILRDLANALCVSVDVLLKADDSEIVDEIVVHRKNRSICKIFNVIFFLILVFLIYIVSIKQSLKVYEEQHDVKIYKIVSDSSDYFVIGKMINYGDKSIIIINNIGINNTIIGTSKDIFSFSYTINVMNQSTKLYSENFEGEEIIYLKDILEDYKVFIESDRVDDINHLNILILFNKDDKIIIPLKLTQQE